MDMSERKQKLLEILGEGVGAIEEAWGGLDNLLSEERSKDAFCLIAMFARLVQEMVHIMQEDKCMLLSQELLESSASMHDVFKDYSCEVVMRKKLDLGIFDKEDPEEPEEDDEETDFSFGGQA